MTNWAEVLTGPLVPWLYAMQETNADGVQSWHDGEQCVFSDAQSAQDEVDSLNDSVPEDEGSPYQVVPLYRADELLAHLRESGIVEYIEAAEAMRDVILTGAWPMKVKIDAAAKLDAAKRKLLAKVPESATPATKRKRNPPRPDTDDDFDLWLGGM